MNAKVYEKAPFITGAPLSLVYITLESEENLITPASVELYLPSISK